MAKKIPLQNGMFAIVDDEDYERCMEFNWTVAFPKGKTIYVSCIRLNQSLPRFIINPPDNKFINFKNGNRLDFRKDNLILVTKQEASWGNKGKRKSTSKYKGVSWAKRQKKWVAKIQVEGKLMHLGYFANEDEAAYAYNKAVVEFRGGGYQNKIGRDNNSIKIKINEKHKKIMKRKSMTSKYRGVALNRRENKWVSSVMMKGITHNLGYFTCELEAAKAYDKKAFELYGDKAILNFPELINKE